MNRALVCSLFVLTLLHTWTPPAVPRKRPSSPPVRSVRARAAPCPLSGGAVVYRKGELSSAMIKLAALGGAPRVPLHGRQLRDDPSIL